MNLKRAWINLIRMPVRTLLLAAVTLAVFFIAIFCALVGRSGARAQRKLEEEYPFFASVTTVRVTDSDGISYLPSPLTLDDLTLLMQSDAALSFNILYHPGEEAEPELTVALPDDSLFAREPVREIVPGSLWIGAVNNLYMVQDFLDGSCEIVEGSAFTEEDMRGGNMAVIIPDTAAAQHGLKPGDFYVYYHPQSYTYVRCVIRGIYHCNGDAPPRYCYIPFSDYLSNVAISLAGLSKADSSKYGSRDLDNTMRIDILLDGEEGIVRFLEDARENGFDMTQRRIVINDKAYRTARSGISEIARICGFILVLTLCAGAVILASMLAFYTHSRKKEREILFCLGMTRRSIGLMLLYEYLMILAVCAVLGTGGAILASRMVIGQLNEHYLAQISENANLPDSADSSGMFESLILQYPVRLRLGEEASEPMRFFAWRMKAPERARAFRSEIFYDLNSGQRLTVHGVDSMETSLSDDDRLMALMSSTRSGGEGIVKCRAPAGGPWKVGDSILLCRRPGDSIVKKRMENDQSFRYATMESYFMAFYTCEVVELADIDAIEMSFDDLTTVMTYLGICSDQFRNVRYDLPPSDSNEKG